MRFETKSTLWWRAPFNRNRPLKWKWFPELKGPFLGGVFLFVTDDYQSSSSPWSVSPFEALVRWAPPPKKPAASIIRAVEDTIYGNLLLGQLYSNIIESTAGDIHDNNQGTSFLSSTLISPAYLNLLPELYANIIESTAGDIHDILESAAGDILAICRRYTGYIGIYCSTGR